MFFFCLIGTVIIKTIKEVVMNNTRKLAAITLIALSISSNNFPAEARVMSGSISEKKQNAKIVKMLNSARKYADKGKNQDAINTYWKILELDSNVSYAYLELGEIYKNLRIYDRSVEMLMSGIKLGENELDSDTLCKYYCLLTEIYTTTNQQGLANKSLIKAAEVAPRNPLPRKILGDIYLKNNRVANAAKAYKKALELDPDYYPASKALNELKLEYGDKLPKEDKDKDYIKKVAVKLAPANKENNKIKQTDKKENTTSPDKVEEKTASKEAKSKETIEEPNEVPENETIEIVEDQPEENIQIAKDNRPLPLDAKEIAKINRKKKAKKEAESKPKTAEEIEKAIEESEKNIENNNNESNESNQHYIEMFLAGNPTEKEEAIDHFINLGKPGLEEIEELMYDSNPNIRILAVRALPLFDDYREEVKTILKDSLDDSDPDVVDEINKALSLL